MLLSLIKLQSAQLLYSVELENKGQILDFFFDTPTETEHAWVRIRYCYPPGWFATIKSCKTDDQLSLDALIQRVDPDEQLVILKGYVLEFLPDDFALHIQSLKDINFKLHKNKVALAVLNGPNGDNTTININSVYSPTEDLKNVGLMFREAPGTETAYTEKHLEAMSTLWQSYKGAHIILEASLLANMDASPDVEKLFPEVRLIVYQFHNSSMPHYLSLKKALLNFYLKGANVDIMTPGNNRDRIRSYVPNVAWDFTYYKLYNQCFSDYVDFIDYLTKQSGDYSIRLLEVQARTCRPPGQIHFITVLSHCFNTPDLELRQFTLSTDPSTVAIIRLRKVEEIDIARLNGLPRRPFILVFLVRGPNYAKNMELDPIDNIGEVNKVNYVVGIQEQKGVEIAYTSKHLDGIREIFMKKKFKKADMAIRLRIDFLANTVDPTNTLKILTGLPTFKWLILHDGRSFSNDKAGNLTVDELRKLKDNIRFLDRETYLIVNSYVRQMIYLDEDTNQSEIPNLTTEQTDRTVRPKITQTGDYFPTIAFSGVERRRGWWMWAYLLSGIGTRMGMF